MNLQFKENLVSLEILIVLPCKINGENIIVITRLNYDDPRNQIPTEVSCYIQFVNTDYPVIEFGKLNDQFIVTPFLRNEVGITNSQALNVKNNYKEIFKFRNNMG